MNPELCVWSLYYKNVHFCSSVWRCMFAVKISGLLCIMNVTIRVSVLDPSEYTCPSIKIVENRQYGYLIKGLTETLWRLWSLREFEDVMWHHFCKRPQIHTCCVQGFALTRRFTCMHMHMTVTFFYTKHWIRYRISISLSHTHTHTHTRISLYNTVTHRV